MLSALLAAVLPAHADEASDRARAARLIRARQRAAAERDAAAPQTPSRTDYVEAPLPSTQTATVCTPGSDVCTTQTVNSVTNGGGVNPAAAARLAGNPAVYAAKSGELGAIDAELATIDPIIVAQEQKRWDDEQAEVLAVPLMIALAPVIIPIILPGTGQLSVNARILGAGNRPGVDGIQGDGFEVSYRQEKVVSKSLLGLMTAARAELGGYKGHGVIGSIGADVGPGLRGSRHYLGATIGAHWTASLYQAAAWFPLQVHAGWLRTNWSLIVSGGFGWRRKLEGDSAAAMIETKGPLGTTSSTFRIAVRRKSIQVGFSYDDFDGNPIGSFNFGWGRGI